MAHLSKGLIISVILLIIMVTITSLPALAKPNAKTGIGYQTVLNPWPSNISVKTHPPEDPPSNPNEAGEAKWNVKASRGKGEDDFKYTVDKDGNIKVTKIATATLTATAEILMPQGYITSSRLYRHEQAHMRISKYEWEKKARKKLQRQMKKFRKELRKKIKAGTLAVPKNTSKRKMNYAAKKLLYTMMSNYLKKAEENIIQQMQTLSNAYDIATNGNQDLTVDPDEAADEIIKSRNKLIAKAAAAQKNKQLKPSNKVTKGTGTGTAEKTNEGLKITKSTVIPTGAGGPFDFTPFDPNYRPTPLGPDEDMEDDQANDTAEQHNMGDYIFEFTVPENPEMRYAWTIGYDMKYSPCEYQGYASYIQVSLAILPTEFNGVNSSLPDPWIDELQAASDANVFLSAWYYFNEPLYDEDGQWLPATDIVPYDLVIAVAEDSGVTTIEGFSYMDPGMLIGNWMPSGTVSLVESGFEGYHDNRSMAVTFDNTIPPNMAMVERLFVPAIDISQGDPQLLEVWVNTLDTDPNCFNNMYVSLRDMTGTVRQAAVTLDDAVESMSDYGDDWTSISIELDDPILAGLNLEQIDSISIGIMNQGFGPFAGTILIDEIRTHDTYILDADEMDVNYDGHVDIDDFSVFAASWIENTIWP